MKISSRIVLFALPAAILTGSSFPAFAGGFYALPACRVVDTRGATGVPLGGPALVAGAARNLKLRRLCGIPDNASANNGVVPLGADGSIAVLCDQAAGKDSSSTSADWVERQATPPLQWVLANGYRPAGPAMQLY